MCILFLTSCGDSEYSVKTNGNSIIIEIPSRTVGISGINEVSYGSISLNEVAEAVYNEFHGISGFFKSGNYDVKTSTVKQNTLIKERFALLILMKWKDMRVVTISQENLPVR